MPMSEGALAGCCEECRAGRALAYGSLGEGEALPCPLQLQPSVPQLNLSLPHSPPTLTPQVLWLDAVAARARYGRWIGGVLPEFVPFPKTGRARGGSKQAAAAAAAEEQGAAGGGEAGQDDSDRHWVYLRRLRWGAAGAAGRLLFASCAGCHHARRG